MRTVPSARERSDHPALLGVWAELELPGRGGAPRRLLDLRGVASVEERSVSRCPDVVHAVWPGVSVTVLPPPAPLRPALGRARWMACGGRRCLAHRLHPARRRRVRDGEPGHVAGRERDPGPEHDEHQRHAEAHAARQRPLGRDQHGH